MAYREGGIVSGTMANRPAAAAANTNYHYFATDYGFGGTLFVSNGSSWAQVDAPHSNRRRVGTWCWAGVSGTRTATGVALPDTFSFSAMSDEAEGVFGLFDNSISAGVGRWGTSANNETKTRNRPIIRARIKTGPASTDIQNCRIRCGLYAGAPYGSGAMISELLAFRYLPALDGTVYWYTESADGGTADVNATATPIAYNTVYNLMIDAVDPTSVKFWIDDVLVKTQTVNLPAQTTALGGYFAEEATGSSQKFLIDFISFEQD
jgi:hypothetical protein